MTLFQAILYPLAACAIGGLLTAAVLGVVFVPGAWFEATADRDPVTGEIA